MSANTRQASVRQGNEGEGVVTRMGHDLETECMVSPASGGERVSPAACMLTHTKGLA